jgi:hypothetical protein
MDFIEKLFGFSPDGGDGMFELMLFALPIAGIVAIVAWRRRKTAAARSKR